MKVTTDSCLFGAWVADEISQRKTGEILDIGTGTGLLALMLAQKSDGSITAIEIDADAIQQARSNISATVWKDQVKTIQADIKKITLTQRYAIIISNPPFYQNEWLSESVKRNLAHHGHELSVENLLDIIGLSLDSGGRFYLLLPYKRHTEIMTLLQKKQIALHKKVLVRQSDNHDYFRFMIEGGFEPFVQTTISEIAIKNADDKYSPEFMRLLKDYYLYL